MSERRSFWHATGRKRRASDRPRVATALVCRRSPPGRKASEAKYTSGRIPSLAARTVAHARSELSEIRRRHKLQGPCVHSRHPPRSAWLIPVSRGGRDECEVVHTFV